jgi:hypothetical protein
MSKVTYEYLFGNEPLSYIYVVANGRPINSISRGHSEGHPSTNSRSLRSSQFHGLEHGSIR